MRRTIVAIAFRILGVLVIAVALVHLYATKLIQDHVINAIHDPELRAFVAPGFILDHVLVTVFMLPIGFVMLWSGGALKAGGRLAYVANWAFSLSILSTPFVIVATMPPEIVQAPVFMVCAAALAATGMLACALLFWARRDFRATPA